MTSSLFVILCLAAAPSFSPNVRVDRKDNPDRGRSKAAITLGPGTWSSQPIYVVFEDRLLMVNSNVVFQKSTDAGRSWLPENVLVDSGTTSPDIPTDRDGNIYVVYTDSYPNLVRCARSTDGGTTWSAQGRVTDRSGPVGWARIVADSAGDLFCAWNDYRAGGLHIWSSVSTDRGAMWSPNVRVDDDTTNLGCYQPDVFVQPGTNHYLVAAEVPRPDGPLGCYLYRSTDMGQTFQPGVRLDTFVSYAGGPHVVADAEHIICNYTGDDAEARTWYTQPDTWGVPHSSGYSYGNGAKLAISADGHVHTALMAGHDGSFDTYYTFSTDHGVSWADPELANEDTITPSYDPDIAADSAGHVYIVWRKGSVQHGEIWLATNAPLGITEQPTQQPVGAELHATVVRNVLVLGAVDSRQNTEYRAELLSIAGRKVMDLEPGANDVRALAPGVYFVREAQAQAQAIRKIVVTR